MHKPRKTPKHHSPLVRNPLSSAVCYECSPRLNGHPILAATALCVALGASPAVLSATFTVTNLNDAGPGSLRQALLDAESNPGADEIVMGAVSGTITLTSGPLVITQPTSVTGPGASRLTLEGDAIFEIELPTCGDQVGLSGMTIKALWSAINANAKRVTNDWLTCPQAGLADRTLTIDDLALTDSWIALSIDGLEAVHVSDTQVVRNRNGFIAQSTDIDCNWCEIVGNDNGASLYYASLSLRDSSVRENGSGLSGDRAARFFLDRTDVNDNGSGLWCDDGSVELSASLVSGNNSAGIWTNDVRLRIVGSEVTGNGVGITTSWRYAGTSLYIEKSTISGNDGDGIDFTMYEGTPRLEIIDSTVAGNGGNGLIARSVFVPEGSLLLENSTVSGNTGDGVAVHGSCGETQIRHSTIANNAGVGVARRMDTPYYDCPITIENSVVSGNGNSLEDLPDPSDFPPPGEVNFTPPSEFNVGYSLIDVTGSVDIAETEPGSNFFGVNPLLGPLQDNGGPTPTHALLPGSPAIDAGAPDFVPPPDYDQRGEGFDRVVNARIDIGAYEVQDGMPPIADGAWVTSFGDVYGDGSPEIAVTTTTGTTQVKTVGGNLISQFGTVGMHVIAVEAVPDLAGSPAPELATLTLDPATGANAVRLYDTLTGASLPSITFDPTFKPMAMAVLDDVNGNGAADVAVLGIGRANGNLRATVKDAFTGQFIKHVWFDRAFTPVNLVAVPDLNGNGSQELALLGYDPVGKRAKVELRDGRFGTWLGNVWFDDDRFEPLDMALVDDINGDGIDEIAILGRNLANGNVKATVKDLKTGQWLNQVWFGDSPPARQLVVVPDFSGNGASEIGALQVDDTREQVRVAFRDSQTREWLGLVWANGAYAPADVAVLPDVNGKGSAELAVLGDVDGQLRTLIKDSATDAWLGVVEFEP